MEAKLLEQVIVRLNSVEDKLDTFITGLQEFSDRFEEVIERIEGERRVDRYGLND